jgi:hypothetical protein
MQKDLEIRLDSLEKRVEMLENFIKISDDSVSAQPVRKKLSIKEFLMGKKVDNDVVRTLAIAYFLENYEGAEAFNVTDVKKAYRAARVKLPSNVNDKINMNINNGHIMEAEKKKESKKAWVLTATGEKYVEEVIFK